MVAFIKRIGPAVHALLVTLVASGLCALAFGGIAELLDLLEDSISTNSNRRINEQLICTVDGEVLIKRFTWTGRHNRIEHLTADRSPAGDPMREHAELPPAALNGFDDSSSLRLSPWMSHRRIQTWKESSYRDMGHDWYLACGPESESVVSLEGYNVRTRERTAVVGPSGFHSGSEEPAQPFRMNGTRQSTRGDLLVRYEDTERRYWNERNLQVMNRVEPRPLEQHELLLSTLDGTYLIDLLERSVQRVAPGDSNPLAVLKQFIPAELDLDPDAENRAGDYWNVNQLLAIRTKDDIRIMQPATGEEQTIPIPDEIAEGGSLNLYMLSQGEVVLTAYRQQSHVKKEAAGSGDIQALERTYDIWRFSDEGRMIGHESVVLHSEYDSEFLSPGVIANSINLAVPAPVFPIVGSLWLSWLESQLSEDVIHWSWFTLGWPGIVMIALFSLWLAWRIDRRRLVAGQGRSWGWNLFVFLFGLPGYVGYRLHRTQDAAIELAPPEVNGLEVFA